MSLDPDQHRPDETSSTIDVLAAMHLVHDLRIALLVLRQCVDSMRRSPHAEQLMRELDSLSRLLDAGRSMADELLVTNELQQAVSPLDVNCAIADACDIIQAIVGPNVRIETSFAKGNARVYARQVDLDRILLNVISNAAAAMPSGGVLVIETAPLRPVPDDGKRYPDAPFGRLRLTIGDTGPGMTVSHLWQVRDSTQMPRPDGSGIGLTSVSLILLRLGGHMEIVGTEGAGTVVEITLPLAPPSDQQIH